MSKYFIYCHTSPSNKNYVGWTSTTIEKRWLKTIKESSDSNRHRPFIEAIRKYGPESFKTTLIEILDDREESLEAEQFWIQYLNTKVPNGYNMTDGGEGNWGRSPSQETRDKISKSLTGKHPSEETRRKQSESHKGANSYMFGVPKSEEICLKISKSLTGRRKKLELVIEPELVNTKPIEMPIQKVKKRTKIGTPHSEETKLQISNKLKGVPKTKEHSENISKGLKNMYVSPELKKFRSERQSGEYSTACKYSDEQIAKVREIRETTGLSYAKIGKIVGISTGYVGDILRGTNRSKPTPEERPVYKPK